MPTRPTKRVPPKTVPNPEYEEFIREDPDLREAVRDAIYQGHVMSAHLLSRNKDINPFRLLDGYLSEVYAAFPDEGKCEIPEEGAWIIVKSVAPTALEWDVPPMSVWRAKPFYRYREFILGRESGLSRKTTIKWPMLRAVIQTPGGELHLLPNEFVTTNIEVWLDNIGQGVTMHFLGAGEPGELEPQLFYIMAHGIPRREALTLLLPSLTDENFCYLTLDL